LIDGEGVAAQRMEPNMLTDLSSKEAASTKNKLTVAPGEIATAAVWLAFYVAIFAVPVASKFAPIGTVVALLSR
jgi:hypothetical protein